MDLAARRLRVEARHSHYIYGSMRPSGWGAAAGPARWRRSGTPPPAPRPARPSQTGKSTTAPAAEKQGGARAGKSTNKQPAAER